jgi:hypothetical protein
LVNSDGYGKNCVEKCPKGTILNETIYQCIKVENDPEPDSPNHTLAIVLGIGGFIILIVVGIIIYLKCIKPKNGNNNNEPKEENIPLTNIDSNAYE